MKRSKIAAQVELSVMQGELTLSRFTLGDFGRVEFKKPLKIKAGEKAGFRIRK